MEEKVLLLGTVCFPMRSDEVMLARKLAKIGAGCLNGFGGGVDPGESVRAAAVRELKEESGLCASPYDLTRIAIMDFHNTMTDGTTFVARIHFFTLTFWWGKYRQSAEMADPAWYHKAQLPLDQMMLADRIFLPVALSGKKIIGSAHYGPFQKELLGEVTFTEVLDLPES